MWKTRSCFEAEAGVMPALARTFPLVPKRASDA
jgi:hypothetical protein